ncbi:MAG: VCBS repeat-containing protein [Planctomycetaceae bacterium]|nr:MAG: VCBS repeat-containing protein [Planctomycetaceae bacterium]
MRASHHRIVLQPTFRLLISAVSFAALGSFVMCVRGAEGEKGAEIRWKMHTINDQSPFEACGAADFNGDGKIDIFCGDSWYEAPSWTRHKVRDVPASAPNPHYYEDFCDSPLDVNGDGRPDIVTCNYFGKRVGWVENPGGDATRPWTEHEVDTPGNMECGELIDINGDGQLDFLPNPGSVVVWYELTRQKPVVEWKKHDLGGAGAGHGIGAGDINSDGRVDIITPKGWYEQPPDANSDTWSFHPEFQLGAAGIFIHGRDVDGDKLTDVIWGMGHGFGLYWLKQSRAADGSRQWTKQTIDDTFSQVHTLIFARLDAAGQAHLITGKRVYAHEVEPGDTDGSVVYSYMFNRSIGKWDRQTIFRGDPALNAPKEAKDRWALKDFPRGTAGTGLQMGAVDIDGDGDIDLVCPGKSGLYLFENLGR